MKSINDIIKEENEYNNLNGLKELKESGMSDKTLKYFDEIIEKYQYTNKNINIWDIFQMFEYAYKDLHK